MNFTVSVLFLTAVLAVGAESTKVIFPANVLKPDLDAILKYNEKSNSIVPAFIHWPKSITFSIRLEPSDSNVKHLKIDGLFKYKKLCSSTNNGLYYINGKFHFKTKTGLLRPVISEKLLVYRQPQILETYVPYLSIRYFALDEIQQNIKAYYEAHKLHFDNVLYENPSTFLLTMPNSEGHFLEYTFLSKESYPNVVDGVLRVLIGQGSNKKVTLRDNNEAYRLVFDQRTQTLKIPSSLNIHSTPITNVFGVRMATTGYLAEVQKSKVKIVNSHDLHVGSEIPVRHFVPGEKLLEKVKAVEPRLTYLNAKFSKHELPKEVPFQVQGNVLVKRLNYITTGEINKYCPFLIEYEEKGKTFLFKGKRVAKLCTDETILWVYE